MSMLLSRRALLKAAAALAIVPGCAKAPPVDIDDLVDTLVPPADILDAWFGQGDRSGVELLGATYLDGLDADAELAALLTPLAELATEQATTASLADALEGDLDAGQVVLPEGWVLGRTEARLCALAWVVGDASPRARIR